MPQLIGLRDLDVARSPALALGALGRQQPMLAREPLHALCGARSQRDDEARRVPDDVRVGDDVAAVVDDHAGAEVLGCPDLHD